MDLRVSGADVREVVVTAFAGLLLFGAAALGNLFSRKKIVVPDFALNTKWIQKDQRLCAFLSEAEQEVKTKGILYVHFLRIVNQLDFLLGDYFAFRQARDQTPQTAREMETIRTKLWQHKKSIVNAQIPNFLLLYRDQNTAEKYVLMEELLNQVKEHVEQYMRNVWVLSE